MYKEIESVSTVIARYNIAKELLDLEMQDPSKWNQEKQKVYDENRALFARLTAGDWDRFCSKNYFNELTHIERNKELFHLKVVFKPFGIEKPEYKIISIYKFDILSIIDEDLRKECNNDIKKMCVDSRFTSKITAILENITEIFHKEKMLFWRLEEIENYFNLGEAYLSNLELSRDILEIEEIDSTREYIAYILASNLIEEENNPESKKEAYIRTLYLFNRISDKNWCREVSDEYREYCNFERKIKIKYSYIIRGLEEFEDGKYEDTLTIPYVIFKRMTRHDNIVIPQIDANEVDRKFFIKTDIHLSDIDFRNELVKIHNFINSNGLSLHKSPYKIEYLRVEFIYEENAS